MTKCERLKVKDFCMYNFKPTYNLFGINARETDTFYIDNVPMNGLDIELSIFKRYISLWLGDFSDSEINVCQCDENHKVKCEDVYAKNLKSCNLKLSIFCLGSNSFEHLQWCHLTITTIHRFIFVNFFLKTRKLTLTVQFV